jgi:hypothetical protein
MAWTAARRQWLRLDSRDPEGMEERCCVGLNAERVKLLAN